MNFLKEIRLELGFNQTQMAEALNILQGSYSSIEKGDVGVSNKVRLALIKNLNVNPDYIDKGIKPILKPIIINKKETKEKLNCYYVPVKAYGGFLSGYEDVYYLDSLERFSVPFIKGECYCFDVEGFSMADEYLPNDKVYCTLVENISHLIKGKLYLFQTIDGIIIKQFNGVKDELIHLVSLNKDPKYLMKPLPIKHIKRAYYIEQHLRNPNNR